MAQGNGDGGTDPASGPVVESVRAQRFELVDEKGGVRAVLGTQAFNGAPGFILTDATGQARIALHVAPDDTPGLTLIDKGGIPRAHVGVDLGGSPAVTLFGSLDRPAQVTLSVTPEGGAAVRLSHGDGRTRLYLSTQPDGTPYVCLMDPGGRPKLSLALPGGSPALLMLDQEGKPRAVMSVTADDGPQFAVLAEGGTTEWSSKPTLS